MQFCISIQWFVIKTYRIGIFGWNNPEKRNTKTCCRCLLVYNLCWATKMLRCIHCQVFQDEILLVFSSHFSGSLLGERIYVSLAHRHHIYLRLSLVVQVRKGACGGLQRLTARSMFPCSSNIIYLLRNIFCALPRTRWGRTSPRTPAWWGMCRRRGSGSRPQIWDYKQERIKWGIVQKRNSKNTFNHICHLVNSSIFLIAVTASHGFLSLTSLSAYFN